ncbi:MAG: ssDNA endonuclease and repair protein rad10 [Chrysothrix sp. TS-e1954]|nr:MAG: ssDNA endonuclease and repair protein rad10 [Chrysothrix sp. TS-e1954]
MDEDFGNDADFLDALHASQTQSTSNASRTAPQAQSTDGKVQQPKPQALPQRNTTSNILVSPRQKGNPILANIRALPWEYADTPADYVLGLTTCALFLSLKYHRLHPEYIYSRIRALAGKFNLRVLLTIVDIENHEEPLRELSKTSLINNVTIILCWSSQEAGRYLELFKSFENASATSIRAHQSTTYADRLNDFITVPRSINKTDALSLISNFGSIRRAVCASPEEVALVDGFGEKKVQRWCNTVRENFRVKKTARRGATGENSRATLSRDASRADAEPIIEAEARPESSLGTRRPIEASGKRSSTSTTMQAVARGLSGQEDDADAEEALMEMNAPAQHSTSSTTAKPKGTNDGLTDGVSAALERLRQGG